MAIIKKDKKRYPAPERQRRDNLELKAQLLALEGSLTVTLTRKRIYKVFVQLVFRLGNTLGRSFSTSHLAEEKKLRIWAQ